MSAPKIDLLTQKLTKLDRMAARIGTNADNDQFQSNLRRELDASNRLSKEIITLLKQGGNSYENQEQQRRFTAAFNRLNDISQRVTRSQRNVVNGGQTDGVGAGGYQSGAAPDQIQVQEQGIDIQFLQFREDELNQRHEGVLQLERDAREVLEMFLDMQELTAKQQEGLDVISSNVESAKEKVVEANVQLSKAEDSQIAAKKKTCCIVLTLVILAAAVVLILYLIS
jgi:syntaxin 7